MSDWCNKYFNKNSNVCADCIRSDKLPDIEPTHYEKTYEMVNHPEHYQMQDKTYEPYKVINAWNLDFNLGSVLKYIARAGKKPGEDAVRDYKKCIEYLQFEIEKVQDSKRIVD